MACYFKHLKPTQTKLYLNTTTQRRTFQLQSGYSQLRIEIKLILRITPYIVAFPAFTFPTQTSKWGGGENRAICQNLVLLIKYFTTVESI